MSDISYFLKMDYTLLQVPKGFPHFASENRRRIK